MAWSQLLIQKDPKHHITGESMFMKIGPEIGSDTMLPSPVIKHPTITHEPNNVTKDKIISKKELPKQHNPPPNMEGKVVLILQLKAQNKREPPL
ncbi:hypothetical protein HPP92_015664 [Vanilla planifolia]|uniref:Uncharacterized protein n=1 Tax=Vanilla planifolia TaxID=51239 RepID=A0A835QGP3_VANPL|nr:hypothetical protein HPP92_015664 [Vanilla planifolia]